jgi:hypothetical protein
MTSKVQWDRRGRKTLKPRSQPWLLAAPALLLSGCTAAGAPAFPEPDTAEAARAYSRAQRADYLSGPLQRANEVEQGIMAGFQRLELAHCEWQRLDERRIQALSRRRAAGRFEAGWFCEVKVHLHNQSRGPLIGWGEGYFYRDGDALSFAGEYAHGWESALGRQG